MGGRDLTQKSAERGQQPGKIDAPLSKKLKGVKWGEYRIDDLFEVLPYKKRFDYNKVKVLERGEHPYIVRVGSNNGQKGYIDEEKAFLNGGNTISFGQDTATMFYQERPYFTGDKVKILRPKMSRFCKANALFFLAAMRKAFQSFSWGGSSFCEDIIGSQTMQLPIKNNEIDFDFMESFIAALENQRITQLSLYLKANGFDNYKLSSEEEKALLKFKEAGTDGWGEYRIGALFNRIETNKLPYKAKDLPKQATGVYTLPCLTSSFQNQGLNYFVPPNGATVLSNVISIPSNSDVYRAYYQSREFTVLSDAYAIRWKKDTPRLSPNQYLFVVMCINKVTNLPIYSYKNKLGGWNVVKSKYIRLPQKDGEIDFDFMETFISAMKKLVMKDVVLYCTGKSKKTKK